MAQQVKELQCNAGDLSLIPGSHLKAGELTPELSSDLCVCGFWLQNKVSRVYL